MRCFQTAYFVQVPCQVQALFVFDYERSSMATQIVKEAARLHSRGGKRFATHFHFPIAAAATNGKIVDIDGVYLEEDGSLRR